MSRAYGVIVLLAKKREKGRMPSFASSCLTYVGVEVSFIIRSRDHFRPHLDRR